MGSLHLSGHMSVITLSGSGSEYTRNGVVNECVLLQYKSPSDPIFIRLDLVMRAFMSDRDVSATAHKRSAQCLPKYWLNFLRQSKIIPSDTPFIILHNINRV